MVRIIEQSSSLLLIVVLSVFASSVNAALVNYTQESAFLAALGGNGTTVDFESQITGDIINSGNSIGDISFSYTVGPPPTSMMVASDFLTTSGNNYLGLDDAGNYNLFIAGDEFSISFVNPVYALGMYFISGDPLLSGDIQLVTDSGTATNSDVIDITLGDGGLAYYIGLVSDTSFTSASIQFDPNAAGTFLYSVDDITTSVSAVPVPATIWLFVSGLGSFLGFSRYRRIQQ